MKAEQKNALAFSSALSPKDPKSILALVHNPGRTVIKLDDKFCTTRLQAHARTTSQ
jgi:hypothetical protein